MCEKSWDVQKYRLNYTILHGLSVIQVLPFLLSIAKHKSKIITGHKNLNIFLYTKMNANKQNIRTHTEHGVNIRQQQKQLRECEEAREREKNQQRRSSSEIANDGNDYASKSVKILFHFRFSVKTCAQFDRKIQKVRTRNL